MARTKILVRSPRIVTVTGVVNDDVRCEIFLWRSPNSISLAPQYNLSKTIVSGTQSYFDVAPFCREYLSFLKYNEVTGLTASPVTEYVYCTVKTYKNEVLQSTLEFTAFDGYGYFNDGNNPNIGVVGLDDGTYYITEDTASGGVYYYNDGLTTMKARYTSLDGADPEEITLTHEVGYVPYIRPDYVGSGGCLLTILSGVTTIASFKFLEQCEPKYTPLNVDFVNRHGQWQRLVMFKASRQSFDMTTTEYSLMPSNLNYNVNQNIIKTFNTQGKDKIKCNTGFVPESYSGVVKQLMLSEVVRLDNVPVILDNKSAEMQTHINDKLINYELSFKYAFNTINDIQ